MPNWDRDGEHVGPSTREPKDGRRRVKMWAKLAREGEGTVVVRIDEGPPFVFQGKRSKALHAAIEHLEGALGW